jgi:hypothetical protein
MGGLTIAHDKRTKEERQAQFLSQLEEVASISRACKKSKVPRRTVYDWITDDAEFLPRYEASKKIAIEALEDEAIRRAHEGVLKPVFQGGIKVGTIREFSDTLLIFMLKGKAPETYREKFSGTISNPDGTPLDLRITIQPAPVPIANNEDDVNVSRV